MREPSPSIRFLAVIIYEHGNAWRCESPHVFIASHPEVAYQMAVARGNEPRYGMNFLGLSHLEETSQDIFSIARSQKGDARALVVDKAELAAFKDPRWQGVPWSQGELAEALREPPALFEIEGLQAIPWHTLAHAYGPALDVPLDIKRLTACEEKIHQSALWQLVLQRKVAIASFRKLAKLSSTFELMEDRAWMLNNFGCSGRS